jgi:hypothetical protein
VRTSLSFRISGALGFPSRCQLGTARRLGEMLLEVNHLEIERAWLKRETYLPLCPKLKSLLRYEPWAEAKKIATASDDKGAVKCILSYSLNLETEAIPKALIS